LSRRYLGSLKWLLEQQGLVAGEPADGMALDVGCGGGRYTQLLPDYFTEVLGVDSEPRYCAAGNETLSPRIRFVCGDATNLPIADERARLVMSVGLTECLSAAALRRFLCEASRVLSPGGVLLCRYWNVRGVTRIMARAGRGPASGYPEFFFYSRREMVNACHLSGLHDVRVFGAVGIARWYGAERFNLWPPPLRRLVLRAESGFREHEWLAQAYDTGFVVAWK
jgi:SAM-dependent methyltransferase